MNCVSFNALNFYQLKFRMKKLVGWMETRDKFNMKLSYFDNTEF